jgi:asparagine synthase (glutamine-hydrolysing)
MGAIIAALNKYGENIVPSVITMLKELIHQGSDTHEIVTPNITISAESIDTLDKLRMQSNMFSNIAIGHNTSRITSREGEKALMTKDYALVFEGRLYSSSTISGVSQISNKLGDSPSKNVKQVLQEFDGSYAFAIIFPKKIIVGRDFIGTMPLYYGENRRFCAIASERKALWKIGLKNVKSFPLGNIATINDKGLVFNTVETITAPQKRICMSEAANILQNLLLESVCKRVADTQKVAVAFSGGLDSSVVAALAKECGVKVYLLTVGLVNQKEIEHARNAAKYLGLPLKLQTYGVEDVERVLSKVLWLIEEPDVMKVGVAIPFFWTAEMASRIGCNILLAGQVADELFGGYQRYLREYAHGVDVVQNAMRHDVMRSHEINFQRDYSVCAFHKVELRLPFTEREVVHFALSLPLELKIASSNDALRKRVLRHLAQNIGIPEFIANRTKKAVQFASGVDKALRILARVRGLTLNSYINQIFREVYPDLEGNI